MEEDLQNAAVVPLSGSPPEVVVVAAAVVGLLPGVDNLQKSRSVLPRADQFHTANVSKNDSDAMTKDPVQMGKKKKFSLATPIKRKTTDSAKQNKSTKTKSVSTGIKKKQTLMSANVEDLLPIVKITVKGIEAIVSLGGLKRLRSPDVYLNEEIIDYFMLKCLKWLDATISPDFDFVYFPTRACQLYVFQEHLPEVKQKILFKTATGYDNQPNLLRKKFLILPFEKEQHWYLVIVCRPFPAEQLVNEVLQGKPYDQCTSEQAQEIYQRWLDGDVGNGQHTQKPVMLVFDSIGGKMEKEELRRKNYDAFLKDIFEDVKRALVPLHHKFWEKNNSEELSMAARKTAFTVAHGKVKVPGQRNVADCGIFIVAYALAWLKVTGQHNIAYTDAAKMDFTLLFSYADLEWERVKMFNDIKTDVSLEEQPLVDRLRDKCEDSRRPTIKCEPMMYDPMDTPFQDLLLLINQRVRFMKLNHEYSSS